MLKMGKSNVEIERDLFGINIKVLKYAGLWNPFTSGFKRILYTIYSIFVIVFIIENGILVYIDVIMNINNIIVIADCLHLLITITLNSIKMVYFVSRYKVVRRLINQLNQGLYPGHLSYSQEEKRAHKLSYYLCLIVVGAGIVSSFATYIKVGVALANFDVTQVSLNDTEPFMALLRVRQWYPKEWWFQHYRWLSFHGTVGVMTWGPPGDMGHDCLIAALLIHTACQFQMIQKRIVDYCMEKPTTDEERYETLKKCLIFHQRAVRFTKELQDLLGPFLLTQFLGSTGILGVAIYKFAVLADTAQKLQMISYILNMLLQLWFHCFFGEMLTTQSSKITNEAYYTPWEKYSNKYKFAIKFLMLKTQKPLQMYAGKFYILSVDTFRGILGVSFSYYTLLQEMN